MSCTPNAVLYEIPSRSLLMWYVLERTSDDHQTMYVKHCKPMIHIGIINGSPAFFFFCGNLINDRELHGIMNNSLFTMNLNPLVD